MENIFYIQLDISSADFRQYYAKKIKSVIATSHDGRRVQFPANILQPFVTHSGVQGQFRLVTDSHARFKSIRKLKQL